jgi:hypothetical protein
MTPWHNLKSRSSNHYEMLQDSYVPSDLAIGQPFLLLSDHAFVYTPLPQILLILVFSDLHSQCFHASVYCAGQPSTMWKYMCSTVTWVQILNLFFSSQLNFIHRLCISTSIFHSHPSSPPHSPSSILIICVVAPSCLIVQKADTSHLMVSHSILSPYPYSNSHTLSIVISGSNLQVPSEHIPAGIYVSINVNSQRC